MIEARRHFSPEQKAGVYYVFSQYLDLGRLALKVADMHRRNSDEYAVFMALSTEAGRVADSVGELARDQGFSLAAQWAQRRMDPEGWGRRASEALDIATPESRSWADAQNNILESGEKSASAERTEHYWRNEVPQPMHRKGLYNEWVVESLKAFEGRPLSLLDIAKVVYAEQVDSETPAYLETKVRSLVQNLSRGWSLVSKELKQDGLKVINILMPEGYPPPRNRLMLLPIDSEIAPFHIDEKQRPSDEELYAVAVRLRRSEIETMGVYIEDNIKSQTEKEWDTREKAQRRFWTQQRREAETHLNRRDWRGAQERRKLPKRIEAEISQWEAEEALLDAQAEAKKNTKTAKNKTEDKTEEPEQAVMSAEQIVPIEYIDALEKKSNDLEWQLRAGVLFMHEGLNFSQYQRRILKAMAGGATAEQVAKTLQVPEDRLTAFIMDGYKLLRSKIAREAGARAGVGGIK